MNILFIVPYAPTPIRVRPYNLIKSLVARGHRITLATLRSTRAESDSLAELEALGVLVMAAPLPRRRSLWNCLRALPTHIPLQAAYCRSTVLRGRIEAELGTSSGRPTCPYDVVHVEHLRGACYGLFLAGAPVVWDSVDCISLLFEQAARESQSLAGRWMTRLDLPRTRRFEGWLVGQFAQVIVTSPADRLALKRLANADHDGGSSIAVLPNGVDLSYFTPSSEPREPDSVVITGKMSYHANVTAALHLVKDIMPLVWRQRPWVKVNIVGADPPGSIRRLAAELPGLVQVTGTVADIRPYLHRASVAAAPLLYGAGIQNKVLEAMACGAPVVALPQACGALEVDREQDLLVAANPVEFARAILRVLQDRALAARLAAAGRRYVETKHDWEKVTAQLERIYQGVMERHCAPSP